MDNFKELIWLKSKWFVYLNKCVLYICLYSPDNHAWVFHNDHGKKKKKSIQNKSSKRVKNCIKIGACKKLFFHVEMG